MKTRLGLLAVAVLLVTATNVFALAGELKEPGVAHAAGYPQAAQEQVRAALKRADCKFLKGHFLNSHTSLLYAGETKALNLFLDDLAKCPGVTLHVSFATDPIPGEPCDWVVSHGAHANRFHVQVNLKSERIKLPDLYLPEVKGPQLDSAPHAAAPARPPVSEASAGTAPSLAAVAAAAKSGETSAAPAKRLPITFDIMARDAVLVVHCRAEVLQNRTLGKVLEVWKGTYAPLDFERQPPTGFVDVNLGASKSGDQAGLREGAEFIVLWHRLNQVGGRLRQFYLVPVKDGKVSREIHRSGLREELTLEELKRRIQASAPKTAP